MKGHGTKVLLFTPLDFREGHPTRWDRGNGLYCQEFRRRGIDATVVAYGVPEEDRQKPIISAARTELENPAWWQRLSATHAVLGGGLDPLYLPLYGAAKKAGIRTVLVLDSGGCLLPWGSAWNEFARDTLTQSLDQYRSGYLRAIGKITYYLLAGSMAACRHLRFFEAADLICTVSPLAESRIRAFLKRMRREYLMSKVVMVPHPIAVSAYDTPVPRKKRQIVAVGRWNTYQKNAPMLIKSLITALGRFPEYRAHIVGTNMETISDELHRRPSEQIVLEGFRPHADLLRLLMQSQIFFLPSRSESFNIAAAEALCCGCSVVAPTHIPTANWFCGYESGTVANKYAVGGLADSLTTEMRLWMSGRRDPFAIAERWMEEVGVRQCAQRLLGAMGIPNETSPSACC